MRLDSKLRLFIAQVIVPPGFTVEKMEQKQYEQVVLLDKAEYTVHVSSIRPDFEGKHVYGFNS